MWLPRVRHDWATELNWRKSLVVCVCWWWQLEQPWLAKIWKQVREQAPGQAAVPPCPVCRLSLHAFIRPDASLLHFTPLPSDWHPQGLRLNLQSHGEGEEGPFPGRERWRSGGLGTYCSVSDFQSVLMFLALMSPLAFSSSRHFQVPRLSWVLRGKHRFSLYHSPSLQAPGLASSTLSCHLPLLRVLGQHVARSPIFSSPTSPFFFCIPLSSFQWRSRGELRQWSQGVGWARE